MGIVQIDVKDARGPPEPHGARMATSTDCRLKNHHKHPMCHNALQLSKKQGQKDEHKQRVNSRSRRAENEPTTVREAPNCPSTSLPRNCHAGGPAALIQPTCVPEGHTKKTHHGTLPPPHCSQAALVSSAHSRATVSPGKALHANPEFKITVLARFFATATHKLNITQPLSLRKRETKSRGRGPCRGLSPTKAPPPPHGR